MASTRILEICKEFDGMAHLDRDWNDRYLNEDTPWDSRLPSRELAAVIAERAILPGRALELGCGTGTNAIWLAQRGFNVTAVDCAPAALQTGRQRAIEANVDVRFLEADVQDWSIDGDPFDFLFDRGCYHCCRRVNLDGYLSTLRNVSKPGTLFLCLAGSVHETGDSGIPKVSEREIHEELGRHFEVVQLRPFRFEDAGGAPGPLGWSTLLRRGT